MDVPLGDMLIRLVGDSKSFENTLARAELKLVQVSERMRRIGEKMSLWVTGPLVGFGAIAVKTFGDFADAMTKSVSVMGDVSGEMRKQLEQTALQLSQHTTTSAVELASAYGLLARQGYSANQSLAALGIMEKFAIANGSNLESSTRALTQAQRVLGLRSTDVARNTEHLAKLSDILSLAAINSGESVEELSMALEHHGGAAMRQFNVPLEEGVALLTAFGQQGIKGGRAGMMLADLLESRRLGKNSTEGNNITQALSQQAVQIQGWEQAYHKAGGTIDKIAKEQMSSFNSQMGIMKNQLTAVAIGIGDMLAPALERLTGWIGRAIDGWNALTPAIKRYIVLGAGIVAAIGPLVILFSTLGFVLSSLTAGFSAITGALSVVVPGVWSLVRAVAVYGFHMVTAILRTALWAASLLLIAAAAVLVTDMVLQMTNQANLGILALVNSWRIGGLELGTIIEGAAVFAAEAWNRMTVGMAKGWVTVEYATRVFINWLERSFSQAMHAMAVAALKGVGLVMQIMGQVTGEKADKVMQPLIEAVDRAFGIIDAGLDTSVESFATYYKDIDTLSRVGFNQTMQNLDQLKDLLKDDGRFGKAVKDSWIGKIMEGKLKIFDIPDIKLPGMPDWMQKVQQPDYTAPDMTQPKQSAAEAQFITTSLHRFALEGPGGLARALTKRTEVHDPEAVKAIREQTQVIKDQGDTATVG